jgi:hypothetical protein
MIGTGPAGTRPMSAQLAAVLTRFPVCEAQVAVYRDACDVHLVALWQFEADPTPRITASQFATPQTAAELRAIADHLDAVFGQMNGVAAA